MALAPGDLHATHEKGFTELKASPELVLTYQGIRGAKACFSTSTSLVRRLDPSSLPVGMKSTLVTSDGGSGTVEVDIATGVVTKWEISREDSAWERLGLRFYYTSTEMAGIAGTITDKLEMIEMSREERGRQGGVEGG